MNLKSNMMKNIYSSGMKNNVTNHFTPSGLVAAFIHPFL